MKETGLTGKRRSTTIAATPDDEEKKKKFLHLMILCYVTINSFVLRNTKQSLHYNWQFYLSPVLNSQCLSI